MQDYRDAERISAFKVPVLWYFICCKYPVLLDLTEAFFFEPPAMALKQSKERML